MNEPIESMFELTSAQKKVLRSMGHHLQPVVYVGKEGLSPALLKSLEAALDAHELVKLKLGQNCPLARDAAGEELTTRTGAALVQIIGRMILLYRPNPDLAEVKRVTLSSQVHFQAKRSNAQ